MLKMTLATLVLFTAISANAAGSCNPEQEACTGPVGGVPAWVERINKWFVVHGATEAGGTCNPERQGCDVRAVGGTPKWVTEMNKWFIEQGAKPVSPFKDNTAQ